MYLGRNWSLFLGCLFASLSGKKPVTSQHNYCYAPVVCMSSKMSLTTYFPDMVVICYLSKFDPNPLLRPRLMLVHSLSPNEMRTWLFVMRHSAIFQTDFADEPCLCVFSDALPGPNMGVQSKGNKKETLSQQVGPVLEPITTELAVRASINYTILHNEMAALSPSLFAHLTKSTKTIFQSEWVLLFI
jgi:hypothetical protein